MSTIFPLPTVQVVPVEGMLSAFDVLRSLVYAVGLGLIVSYDRLKVARPVSQGMLHSSHS